MANTKQVKDALGQPLYVGASIAVVASCPGRRQLVRATVTRLTPKGGAATRTAYRANANGSTTGYPVESLFNRLACVVVPAEPTEVANG